MFRRFVMALIIPLFIFAPVIASEKTGLSVCPSRLHFETAKGFSEARNIKIENSGTEPVIVRAELVEIVKDKNGSADYTKRPAEASSLSSWLHVEPATFALEPKTSVFAKLTLSVPEYIRSHDYR